MLDLLLLLGIAVFIGYWILKAINPDAANSLKKHFSNGNKAANLGEAEEEWKKRLNAENDTLIKTLNELQSKVSILEAERDADRQKVLNLEAYIRDTADELSTQINKLRRHIGEFEERVVECIEHMQPEASSSEPVRDAGPLPAPPGKPEYPLTYYALYPDKEIFGFREDQLLTDSKNAVYQIICDTPETATYQLLPDTALRSQLFNMMNSVVKPFCDIIISSNNGNTIRDVSAGKLRKNGNGWIILSKATIEIA